MGWADCGVDSNGRPIGYSYEAICDHEGCGKGIDRGLSYICGDMHGNDEISCEKYFCEDHRNNFIEHNNKTIRICDDCKKVLEETGEWILDEEDSSLLKEKAFINS